MNINILKTKHFTSFFLLIIVVTIIFSFRSKEVNSITSHTINYTDSTSFIPNVQAGWGSYSSYLQNTGDSVKFELILFRNIPAGTGWNSTSEAGRISVAYRPTSTKIIIYRELPRTWKITVDTDGKCYFKLLNGTAPTGSPVVLPIKTKYKK